MSAQVLFEEDGAFKVGAVREEAGSSLQVEAASGKRSKVKAANVLLRFAGQPLATFMADAQRLADEIDPDFLWQVSGAAEFAFDALAKDYFGHVPAPREAAAVALRLHASPMYFYKRGKGRYQGAPEENLKAALAGVERKRRQQEQVDAWAAAILAGALPEPIAARLDALLFKPDKMSLEWRALDEAATEAGLAIPRLLARGGILASPEDWFLRRFAFERFPGGFAHREAVALDAHEELAACRRARLQHRRRGNHRDRRRFLDGVRGCDDGAGRHPHRRAVAYFSAGQPARAGGARNGSPPCTSPAAR